MEQAAASVGSADGRDAFSARPSMGAMAAAGIAVLILSYGINAGDRTIFPLIVKDVRSEYGFDLPEAGLLSTIFTLGMAAAGIPTGYLMSRCSRKTVMQIGVMIFSAGTVVTVLATGFADMLVYRAVTGIGEAMQYTALLAAFSSYFSRHRAVGIGVLNYAYAIGAIAGPALGTWLLVAFSTWRAPMIAFGAIGFVAMAAVAATVRPWLSDVEAGRQPDAAATAVRSEANATSGAAATLYNLNTVVLTVLSVFLGLAMYGYLGMYPTFLREHLHFAQPDTGRVMSLYGLGVLVSLGSGWLGDRFPANIVMSLSFLFGAVVCALLYNGPESVALQGAFSLALGAAFSGTIFVNLAGYHVRSVAGDLAGRASGLFVTSLFAAATVAGYAFGWLVKLAGWTDAGNVQLVLLCMAGAAVSLMLQPALMAKPGA